MEELIYFNGSLVPRSEAHISVLDYGFLYGYGLFETMRAYHGKIFLLERHLKRLLGSAEAIGLAESLAGYDLDKACRDTLEANSLEDARLRLTVTGGEAESYPWSGEKITPTVVITARPYTPFPPEKYEQGFKACVATVRHCSQSIVTAMKSLSYLVNVVARREAAAKGLDEALLLNEDGYLTEGGGCNAFFVKSSRLVTPSLASGILPGITRDMVLELADKLEIVVTEGTVGIGVIRQCDEAFLTNAMIEVMPLTAVSDNEGNTVIIGGGKPGEITRQLMAAYRERVEKETAA